MRMRTRQTARRLRERAQRANLIINIIINTKNANVHQAQIPRGPSNCRQSDSRQRDSRQLISPDSGIAIAIGISRQWEVG
jgi:hypothetical protein